MLIKLGIKTKLVVYYEAMMSMSTLDSSSVQHLCLHSPNLASTWPITVARQYVYEVKFNQRCSQS